MLELYRRPEAQRGQKNPRSVYIANLSNRYI